MFYPQGNCNRFCLYCAKRFVWLVHHKIIKNGVRRSMLQDICDHVTVAREMFALGNYDAAKTYYEITLRTIVDFIVTILDPVRKNTWQQVRTHTFVQSRITESAVKL